MKLVPRILSVCLGLLYLVLPFVEGGSSLVVGFVCVCVAMTCFFGGSDAVAGIWAFTGIPASYFLADLLDAPWLIVIIGMYLLMLTPRSLIPDWILRWF